MPSSVQSFLGFVGRHSGLLAELARIRAPVSGEELRGLIERHRGSEEASVPHVLNQLLELEIVEPDPAETAFYELTRPVRNLLDWLIRRQRLTSAAVVAGYLDELEALATELNGSLERRDMESGARSLEEIESLVERMRHDSRANREAITSEALSLKAGASERTSRERFDQVNRLWDKYLVPLRQMIEVDQAVDAGLNRLDLILLSAQSPERLLAASSQLVRMRARLNRLRRQFSEDHAEGMREVQPLYDQLRRDTALVRSVSRALQRIREDGLQSLGLEARLALPVWRMGRRLGSAVLAAYLAELKGYEPRQPPMIPLSDSIHGAHQLLTRAELERELAGEPSVGDVLGWLTRTFPSAPVVEILLAYGWIYRGEFGPVTLRPEPEPTRYRHGEVTLLAWSVELARAGAEPQ